MLTSFFKKSKPINFIIPLLVLGLFYVFYNLNEDKSSASGYSFLISTLALAATLLSAYILNFVFIKNKAIGRQTFVLFLAGMYLISNSFILTEPYIIFSGVFIVLAFHRTFSLQTGKFISKKIFDSFFLLSVATLLFPPSVVLMIIPFWGIFYFAPHNYRHWFIPLTAILSVVILKICYDLLIHNHYFNLFDLFDFRFPHLENLSYLFLIPLTFIMLFTLWSIIHILSPKVKGTQNQKRGNNLLVISLFVFLPIVFISSAYTNHLSSTLFLFYLPCILIGGKYLEISSKKRTNEVLLMILLIACFASGLSSLFL